MRMVYRAVGSRVLLVAKKWAFSCAERLLGPPLRSQSRVLIATELAHLLGKCRRKYGRRYRETAKSDRQRRYLCAGQQDPQHCAAISRCRFMRRHGMT